MRLLVLSQRFQRYDSGMYLIPRVGSQPWAEISKRLRR